MKTSIQQMVERLRQIEKTGCSEERDLASSLIEYAEELMIDVDDEQLALKWIPASERLPEYRRNVLVLYKKSGIDCITEGLFCDYAQECADRHKADGGAVSTREFWASHRGMIWFDYAERQLQDLSAKTSKNEVTHWMPLPNPPGK